VSIEEEDRTRFTVGVIVSRCVWNAEEVEMKIRAIRVIMVNLGRVIDVLLGVPRSTWETRFWGGALYVLAIAN